MRELEKLKEAILKDYPRLGLDDAIRFRCGSDLPCFNHCCADVNIFLTPYDVLRLRRALKIGSEKFLAEYTIIPFDKNQNLPVPLLEMDDSKGKRCRFVDPERGCTLYDDRPWPCRMYPLGAASPNEAIETGMSKFYFLLEEDFCQGLKEDRSLTIRQWLEEQGVHPYEEFGELFKDLTLNEAFAKGFKPSPQQMDMYWTALYDLDNFRRFIFESSFLKRFRVEDEEVQALKEDDEALLRFGFRWLDFALFKKPAVPVREGSKPVVTADKNTVAING